jgi:hypothetical protein
MAAAKALQAQLDGGVLFFMVFNGGYAEITKSWICNVRRFGDVLRRTLFVVTDAAAEDAVRTFAGVVGEHLHVVRWVNFMHTKTSTMTPAPVDRAGPGAHAGAGVDVDAGAGASSLLSYAYGQPSYFQFTNERLQLQAEFVRENVTAMVVEADAVWLRPGVVREIEALLGGSGSGGSNRGSDPEAADVVSVHSQLEPPECNATQCTSAGWFATRPTPRTRAFFAAYAAIYDHVALRTTRGNKTLAGSMMRMNEQVLMDSMLSDIDADLDGDCAERWGLRAKNGGGSMGSGYGGGGDNSGDGDGGSVGDSDTLQVTWRCRDFRPTVAWFDPARYTMGLWYENPSAHPDPWVIQNTHVTGVDTKTARAKAFGHWFLASDGKSCITAANNGTSVGKKKTGKIRGEFRAYWDRQLSRVRSSAHDPKRWRTPSMLPPELDGDARVACVSGTQWTVVDWSASSWDVGAVTVPVVVASVKHEIIVEPSSDVFGIAHRFCMLYEREHAACNRLLASEIARHFVHKRQQQQQQQQQRSQTDEGGKSTHILPPPAGLVVKGLDPATGRMPRITHRESHSVQLCVEAVSEDMLTPIPALTAQNYELCYEVNRNRTLGPAPFLSITGTYLLNRPGVSRLALCVPLPRPTVCVNLRLCREGIGSMQIDVWIARALDKRPISGTWRSAHFDVVPANFMQVGHRFFDGLASHGGVWPLAANSKPHTHTDSVKTPIVTLAPAEVSRVIYAIDDITQSGRRLDGKMLPRSTLSLCRGTDPALTVLSIAQQLVHAGRMSLTLLYPRERNNTAKGIENSRAESPLMEDNIYAHTGAGGGVTGMDGLDSVATTMDDDVLAKTAVVYYASHARAETDLELEQWMQLAVRHSIGLLLIVCQDTQCPTTNDGLKGGKTSINFVRAAAFTRIETCTTSSDVPRRVAAAPGVSFSLGVLSNRTVVCQQSVRTFTGRARVCENVVRSTEGQIWHARAEARPRAGTGAGTGAGASGGNRYDENGVSSTPLDNRSVRAQSSLTQMCAENALGHATHDAALLFDLTGPCRGDLEELERERARAPAWLNLTVPAVAGNQHSLHISTSVDVCRDTNRRVGILIDRRRRRLSHLLHEQDVELVEEGITVWGQSNASTSYVRKHGAVCQSSTSTFNETTKQSRLARDLCSCTSRVGEQDAESPPWATDFVRSSADEVLCGESETCFDVPLSSTKVPAEKKRPASNMRGVDWHDKKLVLSIYGGHSTRGSFHDANMCITRGGVVLAALELERLFGQRYFSFSTDPTRLVKELRVACTALLSMAGLRATKMKETNTDTGGDTAGGASAGAGADAGPTSSAGDGEGQRKDEDGSILFRVDVAMTYVDMSAPEVTALKTLVAASEWRTFNHHQAHAALGFYDSPFSSALVFSFDGGGNDGYFNVYLAERSSGMEALARTLHPAGFVYHHIARGLSEVSSKACYEPTGNIEGSAACLQVSGRKMGYAALGTTREDWAPYLEDMYHGRKREGVGGLLGANPSTSDERDFAATSQAVFERVALRIMRRWLWRFPGVVGVVMTGGCGLNVPLNMAAKRELGYPVHIPSTPNDGGLSVGGAWLQRPPPMGWRGGRRGGRGGEQYGQSGLGRQGRQSEQGGGQDGEQDDEHNGEHDSKQDGEQDGGKEDGRARDSSRGVGGGGGSGLYSRDHGCGTSRAGLLACSNSSPRCWVVLLWRLSPRRGGRCESEMWVCSLISSRTVMLSPSCVEARSSGRVRWATGRCWPIRRGARSRIE